MDGYEARQGFIDLLNEIYEPVRFGDLSYDPAAVLEAVDPVAFQEGINDYIDTHEENDDE